MTDQTPSQPTEPSIPDHEIEARSVLLGVTGALNATGGAFADQAVAAAQVHALLALNQALQSIDQTLASGFTVLDARLENIEESREAVRVIQRIEDHLDEIQREIQRKIREG